MLPATIVGVAAGVMPDLDVLISSSTDPLLFLEYHRHFTHSLAFVPFGALFVALVTFRWVPSTLTFRHAYLFAFLGLASHGLLDACTTYGTMLLWPFSDARIAWNNVSVVDPLFTLPVGGLVVLAWRRGSPRYARAAVCWAIAYLSFGVYQTERAAAAAATVAASRGHTPVRVTAMPAIGSLLVWKTVYEHADRYYVDAVRTGLTTRLYRGESAVKLDVPSHFPWLDPGSRQAADVERFRRFAGGFLALDAEMPNAIVDVRYSMVPNEADALWGIVLAPDAGTEEHVRFFTDRDVASGRAGRLLGMLLGTCESPDCSSVEPPTSR